MIPYPIQPVPFKDVVPERGFWADRLRTIRETTLPHVLGQCESTGRIDNFIRAREAVPGSWCSDYPYDDSDVYKCIEGASHHLRTHRDMDVERRLDAWIAAIAAAQEPDGYLYPFSRYEFESDVEGRSRDWWFGPDRWDRVHLDSHELYNVGHLYEAAVAHWRATGKRDLLDVAIRSADLVCRTFGPAPGQRKSIPGHQEIEIGLCGLHAATGNRTYLETAQFFIDGRGDPAFGLEGGAYRQNHIPVREQRDAVGHAVRLAYMQAAMTDLSVLLPDATLRPAIDAVWTDIVSNKLYITGGIGSTRVGEGFQDAFELPNDTAYCETCAAIALALWSHRLFLLTGEAKYADLVERSLYNNVLSGVALAGDAFFYPNVLETEGGVERKKWFGCACCPSNVVRFFPQVPGMVYAVGDHDVYVNLFMDGRARMRVGDVKVTLRQKTAYPWSGRVRIVVEPERAAEFALCIRVPAWLSDRPVHSDLYTVVDPRAEAARFEVNGERTLPAMKAGYARVERTWQPGDTIEFELPLRVRPVRAHENVAANRGRIAIERGPIVYAIEEADNGPDMFNARVTPGAVHESEFSFNSEDGFGRLGLDGSISGEIRRLEAIPYFAWANRDAGAMQVWIREQA